MAANVCCCVGVNTPIDWVSSCLAQLVHLRELVPGMPLAPLRTEFGKFLRKFPLNGRQVLLLVRRQTELAGDFRILKGMRAGRLDGDLVQTGLLRGIQNARQLAAKLFVHVSRNLGKLRPRLGKVLMAIFARLASLAAAAAGRLHLPRPFFVDLGEQFVHFIGLLGTESQLLLDGLVMQHAERVDAVGHPPRVPAMAVPLPLSRAHLEPERREYSLPRPKARPRVNNERKFFQPRQSPHSLIPAESAKAAPPNDRRIRGRNVARRAFRRPVVRKNSREASRAMIKGS